MTRVKSFVVSENSSNLSNPQSSQVLSSLWTEGLAKAYFHNNIETNREFTDAEFTAEWQRLSTETGLVLTGIKPSNSFQSNAKALLDSMAALELKDKRAKITYLNGQRAFGVSNRIVIATGEIKKTVTEKDENGATVVIPKTYNTRFATVTQDGVTFNVSSISDVPIGAKVNISVGCYITAPINGVSELRFGTTFDLYVEQEAQAQTVPVVPVTTVPVPQVPVQPEPQPEPQPTEQPEPTNDGGLDIGA